MVERRCITACEAWCRSFISSLAAHDPSDLSGLAVLDDPLARACWAKTSRLRKPSLRRAYRLLKDGLKSVSPEARRTWGERGARIVSISPGLIDTPLGALEDQRSSYRCEGEAARRRPLKRDGSMAAIADAATS